MSRTKRSTGSLPDSTLFAAPRVIRAAAPRFVKSDLAKASLGVAALAAAILAAMPAAHAQDAPAAGQSSSATPPASGSTTTAPSSTAPAAATDGSSTTPAATAGQGGTGASGQSAGGKSDPVCFQLTGHCVDSSKAAPKAGTSAATKSTATGKKPLNLTAPDVRTVVPESELKEPLPSTDQITETQESETVSVKGEQGVPPDVPGGLGSIWWAVSHPSQAWRILTPAE